MYAVFSNGTTEICFKDRKNKYLMYIDYISQKREGSIKADLDGAICPVRFVVYGQSLGSKASKTSRRTF